VSFDKIIYHLTGPWAICTYTLLLILWVTDGYADTYMEWKNKVKPNNEPVHHLRMGHKFYSGIYLEGGKRTDGYSAELGYKYKFKGITVKGKLESNKVDNWKHTLETKVRYTFD
tara:strand:- start:103 stop:444 length:342 start_codon:yes stop_codon:yes gene_type:complete